MVWLGKPDTDSTWENASDLPSILISDYERGVKRDIGDNSFSSGGETFHTLSSCRVEDTMTPPPSKTRRITVESTSGGYEYIQCIYVLVVLWQYNGQNMS